MAGASCGQVCPLARGRAAPRPHPTTFRGVLSHVRKGSGEPLVLVHGIGSQWQAWSPVLERIAAERDVVAVDLPGFGASAPLDGEVSLASLAHAVAQLAGELGMER